MCPTRDDSMGERAVEWMVEDLTGLRRIANGCAMAGKSWNDVISQ